MQSTYAESIAGYSGFTRTSDPPPLLGLKSRLVQKGKLDGEVHALYPWTTKQPSLPCRRASDRARNGGHVASWEMGAQRQQDRILAEGRPSLPQNEIPWLEIMGRSVSGNREGYRAGGGHWQRCV